MFFSWGLAMILESLGQVMTIFGATTNSGIGFLIPIVFYMKVIKQEQESSDFDKKAEQKNKIIFIFCYISFAFVILNSGISLYTLFTPNDK
jgi:amino acid permease